MKVSVKAFGIAREILGSGVVQLDVPGQSVADLRVFLESRYPGLLDLRSLFIAVNQKYAQEGQKISEGDEIALIPPTSGG
jgi:molybdopterin synthase sulfur carrier subunit